MNEEIIEEVVEDSIDNTNENTDNTDMVNSGEENETVTSLDEDILMDALLHVIETKQSELKTESGNVVIPEVTLEAAPTVDYTDILTSIDARLDNIETVVCVTPEPEHDLETPLNDLNFNEVCLVAIIVFMITAVLIKFITKNSFHI